MRTVGPISFGSLLLAVLASGCRLPYLHGPVPDTLATSRQLSQQGLAAMERGQPQEAETLLAKAVKTCPVDPEARRHYAEALWQRGARADAVRQEEEACRLLPDDPAPRVRLAEMDLALGQLDAARKNAETAIGINPKLGPAWAVRGRVLRANGDLSQALADYHRAMGLLADDRQLLLELAELYRQINQPQRALEALQSLAETYYSADVPQQVHYLEGLAYTAVGRYDDAVQSLSAAAICERPTPEILCRLGEAQWLAGRPAEASAALQHALALDPRHPGAQELLRRMELAARPPQVQR
jgi:tetratricopeptide (TPR) repeat protein